MDYKAKATHAVFEPYKRPANARVIRRDIDIVTSDSDISDNKPPFYYQTGSVAQPSISCQNNMVTIQAPGSDSVYYTIDGSVPDTTKTEYVSPFTISQTVTVKAIAYFGELQSAVSSRSCTYIQPPAQPSITVTDNMVTIACPSADSVYYTTDGTEPDSSKTRYSAPFAISSAVTVKAVGYKSGIKGISVSHVCSEYLAPPAAPTISCADNQVTITPAGGTATYYTIDGSEPDNTKNAYSAPFPISATVTVKAVSYNGNIKGAAASQECVYAEEVITG